VASHCSFAVVSYPIGPKSALSKVPILGHAGPGNKEPPFERRNLNGSG
jgi:hypothetical protein